MSKSTDTLLALPPAQEEINRIRAEVPDIALVVVDNPPDTCCRIGFDVIPVLPTELPEQGFKRIGQVQDVEVLVEEAILPSVDARVTIGVDGASGLLMATIEGANGPTGSQSL